MEKIRPHQIIDDFLSDIEKEFGELSFEERECSCYDNLNKEIEEFSVIFF